MEFLDKGMKGILTEKFSSNAIKTVQEVIFKFLPKLDSIKNELKFLIEKQ